MGLTGFLRRQPRLLLASVLVLTGFGAFSASAAGQEGEGEATSFTTIVRLCLEPGCTEMLDLTEPVDGVPVEVADAVSSDPIGSCVTGDAEAGACVVEIPAGVESLTITLDETAFPEGYESTGNPGAHELANGSEYPFLLFPEGGFPPDDDDEGDPPPVDGEDGADTGTDAVSGLPETGAGPERGTTDVLLTAIVALASMSGLAAMLIRRALGQR